MGHNHSKVSPSEAAPSCGPDHTIFRSSPPLLPSQLLVQSTPMRPTETSATLTRIDHVSAGDLPKPMSKSRSMVRKLSQKAGLLRGGNGAFKVEEEASTSPTGKLASNLDDDLKVFETLVINAEASVPSNFPIRRTIKAGTIKRSSTPSTPYPGPAIPVHLRSVHHRRTSFTSFHSDRSSVKTARRAEREWRAHVAGLAGRSTKSPAHTPGVIRGPVPPRRTPGFSQRSPSPEDDKVVTPWQTEIDTGTPAKSIMSRRSFETLGYYAHLDGSPIRDRKVSVPQSITSFYFDPNTRGGTRPSSLASTSLLTAIPPSPTIHKDALPPLDSFLASSSKVNLPLTPYSPITTHFLYAPIDQIRLTGDESLAPARENVHPYAVAGGQWVSSPPPTPPSKSALTPTLTVPVRLHSERDRSFDPCSGPPRRPLGPRARPNTSIPDVLKVRKSAPRVQILGAMLKAKRAAPSLTPGGETGVRPPKSGLPAAVTSFPSFIRPTLMDDQDLEKWLQDIAVSG